VNSPDRAPPWLGADAQVLAASPPAARGHAGALELLLPLWHRKWRLLVALVAGAVLAGGLALLQPLRFSGQASFIVQPTLRPSQGTASLLPGLAGLVGQGTNPVDVYVTIMRSQAMAERVIERFELQRVWDTRTRTATLLRLSRSVSFGTGRRDGLVVVNVEDDNPARAAAIANQYVEELRGMLRSFAVDEARQRRLFYDAQLEAARISLALAQRRLQESGFDAAALRVEPRAAAEGFGRLQAEVAAAEVRLSGTRRVRSDNSSEVLAQQNELAALRAQLERVKSPPSEGKAAYVERQREFRAAEAMHETMARQLESARLDEASDSLPLRLLDRAVTPDRPSSPRLLLWVLVGAASGLLMMVVWVLVLHRAALASLDPAHAERVALLRSVMSSGFSRPSGSVS
jgi:uncharacterized protein involved in exopolysaccharide biosynthesis